MKKFSKLLLIVLVLLSMFSVTNVKADNYIYGNDNVVISSPVKHSIFGAGETVTVNESVDGLAFLGGAIINVNKESEYVFAAGNQININANVTKDLFAAGNNVVVKGDIGKDAYIAASSVMFNGTSKNLFVTGVVLDLSDAVVEGDVKALCTTIILNEKTEIKGTFTYDVDSYVSGLDLAKIENTKVENLDPETEVSKEELLKAQILSIVTELFTTLASLIILFGVFPKLFKLITKKRSIGEYGSSALKGAGLLIIIPIALLLSIFLVVTIPLALIGFAIYGASIYIGSLLGAILLGHLILTKLFKGKENKYLSILIGGVLFTLIGLVPVVGGVFIILISLIGLGLVLELFKKLYDYAK